MGILGLRFKCRSRFVLLHFIGLGQRVFADFQVFRLGIVGFCLKDLASQGGIFGPQLKKRVNRFVAMHPASHLGGAAPRYPFAGFTPVMAQLVADDKSAAHIDYRSMSAFVVIRVVSPYWPMACPTGSIEQKIFGFIDFGSEIVIAAPVRVQFLDQRAMRCDNIFLTCILAKAQYG